MALGTTLGIPLVLAGGGEAQAAGEVELSGNRPATASSVRSAANGAASAFDGKSGTRWTSAAGTRRQWLRVDLGTVSTVTHAALSWDQAFAKAYTVQTSVDGTSWTTIYATTTGNGRVDDLTGLSGSGRYVRVVATTPATTKGYSLREFTVYGRSAVTRPAPGQPARVDLTDPRKKDIAMRLVSSAENSSLDWRAQYGYIEDIGDGRGYTAGIIGFCSGTGDMLELVEAYTARVPGNVLAKYLPALRAVDGGASHAGLGEAYVADWRRAAQDPAFQRAQNDERDRVYFDPAVSQAKADGLRALGQFVYYDAIVMHGPGDDPVSFGGIRRTAMSRAKTPAQGGDETAYLHALLDARVAAMRTEAAHDDTSRVDTAQRVFLDNGNLDLDPTLTWKVYGDPFTIA